LTGAQVRQVTVTGQRRHTFFAAATCAWAAAAPVSGRGDLRVRAAPEIQSQAPPSVPVRGFFPEGRWRLC